MHCGFLGTQVPFALILLILFEHVTKICRTVKLDEKGASYPRKCVTVNLVLMLPVFFFENVSAWLPYL